MFSKLVGRNEEGFGRIEEIAHEIREDINNRLSPGEFFAHQVLQRCGRFCGSEQELPPAVMSDGKEEWFWITYHRI